MNGNKRPVFAAITRVYVTITPVSAKDIIAFDAKIPLNGNININKKENNKEKALNWIY